MVTVYTASISPISKIRRKMRTDRVSNEWYGPAKLGTTSLFFLKEDIDEKTISKYKRYTLKELHDFAVKKKLVLVKNAKILEFGHIDS